MAKKFNVRVYGILLQEGAVLVSDEYIKGNKITKFPGGGLEFGEGTRECLAREFKEELDLVVEVTDHFYTTDFYIKSAFNDSQIISIYYLVRNVSPLNLVIKTKPYDFDGEGDVLQSFRWVKIEDMKPEDVTFPTDQHVVKLLIDSI